MSVGAPEMTTARLLAMPDNGGERWLIGGQLRKRPKVHRNRWNSRVLNRVMRFLDEWLDPQPYPRGSVLGNNVGFRLERHPDTTVGIDAVYISPELATQPAKDSIRIEGVPVLAVAILSPAETQELINEKTDTNLRAGKEIPGATGLLGWYAKVDRSWYPRGLPCRYPSRHGACSPD